MKSPTPQTIRTARLSAGMTQAAFAALAYRSAHACENWEKPEGHPEHRACDPAVWELITIKLERMRK